MDFLLDQIMDQDSCCVSFSLMFTPKYHCEMAGEGIEYAWGLIKRKFRALPLRARITAAKFKEAATAAFIKFSLHGSQRKFFEA
jgi:hypothetical protein